MQLTDPDFQVSARVRQATGQRRDQERHRQHQLRDRPAARPITVHDLLRHTAGLAYGEITNNPAVKEAYAKASLFKAGVMEYEARDMTPPEQVERLAAIPLCISPAPRGNTAWRPTCSGASWKRRRASASAEFLQERLFGPLQMADSGVPCSRRQAVAPGAAVGRRCRHRQTESIDRCLAAAAERFGRRRRRSNRDGLSALRRDDARKAACSTASACLSRTTVELMASDHLGTRITTAATPGELVLGTPGYTFGLGFMVRQGARRRRRPGLAGRIHVGRICRHILLDRSARRSSSPC